MSVEIRWVVASAEPFTVTVVRTTRTVETLAGPFTSVSQAKRWIAQHADQTDLFDDENQPELFAT